MTQHKPTGLMGIKRGAPVSIPLTGVKVDVETKGPFGRVTVTQEYANREEVPVEAVYIFPLEEGSAVSAFSVLLDGRRIRGRVLPREEAFDRYDDAMAEGHGAFLLDQERPNIFTASVGNLRPGETATIELSYLTELPAEGDGFRLMIPTTVSPRYVPESDRNFHGLEDARRVSPPVSVTGVPYRMELTVRADLLSPVKVVESPSHKIRTEIDGNIAMVTLTGDEGALDRDFVLTMVPKEPHRAVAIQGRDDEGDRYALVSFRPNLTTEGERPPVEVVFVVDCSGSMHGTSIEQARRTLLLCLQSLSPGDRFNVVRFGSTHESLFRSSKTYDDITLAAGRKLAESLEADLGGTRILEPLTRVLEADVIDGLPRRVVLLTDGQVSNEDAVMQVARQHRKHTSIFSVGIGAGSSEYLVRGLARASGGAAEFVHPGETIEEKVLRHFGRIAGAGAEFEVSWEGIEVADVLPTEIPALAPGDTVTLLARITGGTEGSAVLSGTVANEPVRAETRILEGPRDPDADSLLPVLWGRRKIRDLEEGEGLRTHRGSRQPSRARTGVESELVRLGVRYGLMSSATSYVAIEERSENERVEDRAELREIPVALTSGWGGLIGGPRLAAASLPESISLCDRAISPPAPAAKRMTRHFDRKVDFDDVRYCIRPEAISESDPGRMAGGMPREDPNVVPAFYYQQTADGSWRLTAELANAVGGDLDILRAAAAILGHPEAESLLATLIVLAHSSKLSGKALGLLTTILRKARLWVDKATAGSEAPAESWLGWARALVPSLKR